MNALDDFDVVIVDDGLPPLCLERMKSRGINVVVAHVARTPKVAD